MSLSAPSHASAGRANATTFARPAAPGAPGTLPVQLTRLVGREREIAAVRGYLATTRLLTLTGAGGSGKTRLALEAARLAAGDFAAGAAWVELAPLGDPSHLADHVAGALGLRAEEAGSAEDVLVGALAEREMLLVLDNCEHLVDACAPFAELLLMKCPALRILATSREALAVAGERSWLVPVLSLADDAAGLSAAEAMRAESVQLFVQRAQDALPSFALTDANAGAVVRICRRVDGLPLAIELAAARVRVLAPEQIAARLDESFRLLAGGPRTALPRHRTLHEAIDWSYRLLDERERRLLARLSVFAGDWPLEAAEAVCAADAGASFEPLEAMDVLDLVAALVDKSLVVMREETGASRYRLLETIRQYAAERLEAALEAPSFRARHARHYAALAARAEPDLVTSRRPEAVARLARELDDVRAALAWSHEHEPALHLRFAGALTWLWYSLGHWAEGRRWLEEALALPEAARATRDRAAALFGAGAFASLQADTAAAVAWLGESISLARAEGDERLAAYASNYLGLARVGQSDPEGDAPVRDALAWFREAGDLYGLRLALLLLATHHRTMGDVAAAEALAEEAVEVARAFGMERELGIALQMLADIVLSRGDAARADALVREAVRALRRDAHPLFMARGLDLLAIIAARRGEPIVAARRFGAAAAARGRLAARQWRTDRSRFAPLVEAARAAAGADAFDAAWQDGCRLALDAAVDEVLAEEPLPGAAAAELTHRPREAAATRSLAVRMLGPLEIVRDGAPLAGDARRHARSRELLLFLLLHPEGRTREQIGLAFWPEASAAQVKNNFHVTLHHLRRALGGAHWIVFEHDRYRIDPAVEVTVDARTFERDVRDAVRASHPLGDEAIARLRGALAAYRGDLLDGESVGDWHLDAHDRLRRVWADGTSALGERLARSERWDEAAAVYRDLVAREELDEGAHRRLMTCLSRAGERAPAMRAYERLAARLAAELDTVPERETTALYDRLRRAESL